RRTAADVVLRHRARVSVCALTRAGVVASEPAAGCRDRRLHPARRRAGCAAAVAGAGADLVRPARGRNHLPLRRVVELARPERMDHDAPAARVGRPARLHRTDELLGITGVFWTGTDG